MSTPIRYRSESGPVRHGLLVKETASKVYVILIESPVHIRKLPKSERMFMAELEGYKEKKVKRQLRQYAKERHTKLSSECKAALR